MLGYRIGYPNIYYRTKIVPLILKGEAACTGFPDAGNFPFFSSGILVMHQSDMAAHQQRFGPESVFFIYADCIISDTMR